MKTLSVQRGKSKILPVRNAPLSESEFISEGYRKQPWRFWLWFLLVAFLSLLFWGMQFYYATLLDKSYRRTPFLQVTNRQISLFLWQNPEFMRVNVTNKSGYLPAFDYLERVGLNPQYADDYAIGPLELFFRYHTWQRQVGSEIALREIITEEFRTFLAAAPEWQPHFWADAPEGYRETVATLGKRKGENLNRLSEEQLPIVVRHAFIGWKNYFLEGKAISDYTPTYEQVYRFLEQFPHYGRQYWCNIVGDNYLKTVATVKNLQTPIPRAQLSPFLQAALYNDQFRSAI